MELFFIVFKALEIYNEDLISSESLVRAKELCKGVDPKDAPFVALTLELEGEFWTSDKQLIAGLQAKGADIFYIF